MRKILLSALFIGVFSATTFAQSQLISFEASEGYNLGDINGQQGWVYWGGLDPNTGMVTSSSSTNGTRSLNFISNGYLEEAGAEKTVTGYNKTAFSFDYKIEDIEGSIYTIAAWDTTYKAVGAFVVDYVDGNVGILNGDVLENTNLNLVPGTWYNFKMVVDMNAKTVEYFVKNTSYGVKSVKATATGFNIIDFYYDDYGTGFTVDNIKVEDASLMGAKDFTSNDHFSVSPNPTVDFINIKTDAKINKVDVIDFSGKIVYTDVSGTDKVNITSLPAGPYLLQINTSQGLLQKKIIKK